MASSSDQVQDPNDDSLGDFSMLVHNCGGRRRYESMTVRVQADLDETRTGGMHFILIVFAFPCRRDARA